MCGIVGYVGTREAGPILIEGLRRLEYRGYDSAGLAVVNGAHVVTAKEAGKLNQLEASVASGMPRGRCGIAHTRWATHGPPTRDNAHPHVSGDGEIALVHNGIIENADVLRRGLEGEGYVFQSETDTEALVHLIDHFWAEGGPLEDAVAAALRKVDGAYGIAVVSSRDPGKIVVARHGSPLLIGVGPEGEMMAGSDAAAVVALTREVVYLDDGDYAVLEPGGYRTFHLETGEVERAVHHVSWDLAAIEKGGHDHFMHKEIFEQPTSLRNVMRGRLLPDEGDSRLGGVAEHQFDLGRVRRVVITACGTSWHAGLVGELLLEEYAGIPVEVEYASEFRYKNPVLEDGTLVLAVSQSGETADTLAALKEAKHRGVKTMGVVNVVGSTIARATDFGIYLHAGPEIGVASTKAFTSQIAALALFTLHMARRRTLSVVKGKELVDALERLPGQVEQILAMEDEIKQLAYEYKDARNFLYLGRGYQFPVALEGALKLKEVSYIHAEGYPAAEMKHGPIALIDDDMPVVFLAPRDPIYAKVVSNVEEVKARGGRIIAVVTDEAPELQGKVDHLIRVPHTVPGLMPILTSVPLQLLAYHVAVARGADVDQPRNLAKSVTVE
ncbi:MAG: glutamine--fructose-6-phosphate transaminase (isomerizing) [Gemmatimonadota bacterium]|nr:glutamine--fructose-6-phosphate transaminase (isomerizing) [Gemmatimonadota bacterium]MDH5758142.1 glutamine--fructose-6-phosphate transaminase (isomerizing) [Gemmatimonadota bacterium]